MNPFIDGLTRFQCDVFPTQRSLYPQLARDGQQPKALVISCADSRVIPELITQSGPGNRRFAMEKNYRVEAWVLPQNIIVHEQNSGDFTRLDR